MLHATPSAGSIAEEKTFIPEIGAAEGLPRRAHLGRRSMPRRSSPASRSRSILPLMFIGLPRLYGALASSCSAGSLQHAGLAEDVLDHRLNCRTVYMNPVFRFLYWNMNYHVEHHMFPMVPYHALPGCTRRSSTTCPPPYRGFLDAYRKSSRRCCGSCARGPAIIVVR